ncbi:hypothetical protein HR12_13530, partial [Microbacterium sp. SUBG005]
DDHHSARALPRLDELVAALPTPDATVTAVEPGFAQITGLNAEIIGDLAAARGIPLYELTPRSGSLEDAYLALTDDSVEYKTKEIA